MMDLFAYDRSLVSNELAQLRYEASIQPGFQETFSQMFPPPRQRSVEALASKPQDIKAIKHETLILHGREDLVVPPVDLHHLIRADPQLAITYVWPLRALDADRAQCSIYRTAEKLPQGGLMLPGFPGRPKRFLEHVFRLKER